jgi:ATP-dependent RNA helicase SUPV3L1/SUV3
MSRFAESRVTAVLGPTNTGKTHLAIERMLGHASGVIGFPLRLLARENYDRVVKAKGAGQVALVTGEEKILPPGARYFCCTVESMPLDRAFAFLAIDEVQLAADRERGHIFTDRLLHARGEEETMLLGADTIRPILKKLVPEAQYVSRPRFSTLTYSGPRKITRLPARSAVVAFSAAEVYATAELLRRQRGGTAVVLGALSPRTRNAQVGMFEAGEVDYLVATDAIGMGLNLNLDHVAFARLSKFDGLGPRRLSPAEVGQIAGRAGRHMSDGTFGTTADVGPLDQELVEAVEQHNFEPLHHAFWRNRDLDFRDPRALLKSLERRPPVPELLRAREADDYQALAALVRDPEVAALASHREAVRLLWEVCQIPDFRKILSDQHARLIAQVYGHLMRHDGQLPVDWVARQLARIARPEGDIDQLVARIAHIRTWTYITHRGAWLSDPGHWQAKARKIEDELSDALHDRLTRRFVDQRASFLVRRLRTGEELLGAVKSNGEVLVEGQHVGRLEGFNFLLDGTVEADSAKPLLTAARRALTGEIPARLKKLEEDNDGAFALEADRITWRGIPVARLIPGERALSPGVEALPSDFLDGPARERVRQRVAAWLARHIRGRLKPLFDAESIAGPGAVRGILFQLVESLGTLPRRQVAEQIAGLTKADRKTLASLGVRLGAASLFVPALMKPRAARLAVRLWALKAGRSLPAPPDEAAICFTPQRGMTEDFCHALGFRRFTARGAAPVAIRADALERLAHRAHKLGGQGSFSATPELLRPFSRDADALAVVLRGLGYQVRQDGEESVFSPKRARRPKAKTKAKTKARTTARGPSARQADSPFAVLRELTGGKGG